MVCPQCRAHVLLSRYSPQDIWLLKTAGLSNAEVGRLLSISRERVRQLCNKYEAEHEAELTALLETNMNNLVKKAQEVEKSWKYEYVQDEETGRYVGRPRRGKRLTDRRTLKKRIIAELNKLKAKEAHHERSHNQEG